MSVPETRVFTQNDLGYYVLYFHLFKTNYYSHLVSKNYQRLNKRRVLVSQGVLFKNSFDPKDSRVSSLFSERNVSDCTGSSPKEGSPDTVDTRFAGPRRCVLSLFSLPLVYLISGIGP